MSRSASATNETGDRRSGRDDGSRSFPLICGALAGFVATAPMTAAMQHLHRRLDTEDRYPLPPREITSSILPELPDARARDVALVAHFAYGGLCGLLLAGFRRRPSLSFGVAAGLGIWLGSYLGWIPGLNVLKPATDHPAPRNATMIAAHIVWGAAYSLTQAELMNSERILTGAPLKDVSKPARRP